MKKIKISLLTVGRMDWSYCCPLAKELENHKEISLRLLITGSHLIYKRGYTLTEICKESFKKKSLINLNLIGDSPRDISMAIGSGVIKFADEFYRHPPDILVVNGDRFETLSAVTAAQPFNIIIAHIGGGERTEGAIDENIRHAVTKMSHLHFTENKEYKNRIIQMGEEPKRIFNVGSLSLESMKTVDYLNLTQARERFCNDIEKDFLLITFHPATLKGYKENKIYIVNLLKALERVGFYCVFTYPNIDTHNSVIINNIKRFLNKYKRGCFIVNAGKDCYYSLMKLCRTMVGNSSSAIIESPYFKIPVVNIGDRQKGRIKTTNIIEATYETNDIVMAIERALSRKFYKTSKQAVNPFSGKNISRRIASKLIKYYKENKKKRPILKNFKDIKFYN